VGADLEDRFFEPSPTDLEPREPSCAGASDECSGGGLPVLEPDRVPDLTVAPPPPAVPIP
jgi:hypothetical protein